MNLNTAYYTQSIVHSKMREHWSQKLARCAETDEQPEAVVFYSCQKVKIKNEQPLPRSPPQKSEQTKKLTGYQLLGLSVRFADTFGRTVSIGSAFLLIVFRIVLAPVKLRVNFQTHPSFAACEHSLRWSVTNCDCALCILNHTLSALIAGGIVLTHDVISI